MGEARWMPSWSGRQHGRLRAPIGSNQAVAHALADVATRLEASRISSTRPPPYEARDPRVTVKAAMARVSRTEAAQAAIDTAIQFHGASGLEAGHLLEGLYREVRATRIFEVHPRST